jgi:hypothetical protein
MAILYSPSRFYAEASQPRRLAGAHLHPEQLSLNAHDRESRTLVRSLRPYSGHIVEFLITSMWDQFLALWHGLAGLTNAQLP